VTVAAVAAVVAGVGVAMVEPDPEARAQEPAGADELFPAYSPTTQWEKVLAQVGSDGSVSKETALQAFAVAYGPIPGVEVPSGPPGEITSGTFAVRAVSHHWASLSAVEQAAILALHPSLEAARADPAQPVIAKPTFAGLRAPARAHLPLPGFVQQGPGDAPQLADDREIVDRLVAEIADRLDVAPLPFQPRLAVSNGYGGENGLAFADADNGPNGCTITFYPPGIGADAPVREFIYAHEVMHCYQGFLLGKPVYDGESPWRIEGMADWVAVELRRSSQDGRFWEDYLKTPDKSLFAFAYSARGFYHHLQYNGIDPWTILVDMLLASSDADAFTLATKLPDRTIVEDWPSGALQREAPFPRYWDTTGIGIPERPDFVGANPYTNGQETARSLEPAGRRSGAFAADADVLVWDISSTMYGHIRLPDNSEPPLPEVNETVFSTIPNAECPPGSANEGTEFTEVEKGGIIWFGLAAGLAPASYRLRGLALEDYCQISPECPPTGASATGGVLERLGGGGSRSVPLQAVPDDCEPPIEPPVDGFDPCLVGSWTLQRIEPADEGFRIEGMTGAITTFDADGRGGVDFDPSTPATVTLPDGSGGTMKFTGGFTGQVATENGEMSTLSIFSNDAYVEGEIEVPGLGSFPFEGSLAEFAGDAPPWADEPYTCSPSTLTYGGVIGRSTWSRN
jgi:hypothetical protein